ncbi:MAG TPA: GWxTD domain-containing protein, partial [Candidatus Dormibacteraeota bacterium]|nr:GWxTD domain-containing protein [Candidatus Dormibacteraeota bacterium]
MRGLLPGILAGTLLAVAGGVHGGPPRAENRRVPGETEEHRRPAKRTAHRSIDYDAPSARWREGPVRYLLAKDEDDAFRLLKTDEERAEFIRRFWASRDPDASTPENEYRTLFYARVTQADYVFTDSTKPGWKTDRGKIFILLGPPDDFEQKQEGNDIGPETITWTYRNNPAGIGFDAFPVVRFDRDDTGEYHLSNKVLFRGFETELGIAFQNQAMQMKSLPPQKKVPDTSVSTRAVFDSGPFRTHRDFFRSGDGNTFTVL